MKTTFAALLLAAFALPHGALGDDDRDDDRGRWRAEWYGPPGVWVDGPIYRYGYVQAVPPPPVYQGWYYGPPVVDYGWYGPPPGWRVERRWTGRWRDWDDDD